MAQRARQLRAMTGLLYIGPLLAGLAGFGLPILPAFVAIFIYSQMLIRPLQRPHAPRGWVDVQVLVTMVTVVLTQILLVAVLIGIGRGVGGAVGSMPALSPLSPVTLSLLAVYLMRLTLQKDRASPRHPAAPQVPVLEQVQLSVGPHVGPAQSIVPLLTMPDDVALTELGPLLEAVLDDSNAQARLACLTEALETSPTRHATLRQALVIWATEPGLFVANLVPTAMHAAFRVAGHDPQLLSDLLPRAAALARIMPERRSQFPDRAALAALTAAKLPPPMSHDLDRLLAALDLRPAAARRTMGHRLSQPQPG